MKISPLFSVLGLACTTCFVSSSLASEHAIDLSGRWSFQIDRDGVGEQETWFTKVLEASIQLPGSLQSQGFGDEVSVDTPWTGGITDRSWFESPRYARYRKPGHVKIPFWLQPDKHYVGVAWYQKTIDVPPAWRDKRILLSLERCHWQTTVWSDETKLPSRDSLSTPHEYDLTYGPWPRRITIRVDNRLIVPVGINSHSVTDHTQSNWNGIVGNIRLVATDRVWIDDVQVYPNVAQQTARVRIRLGNMSGSSGDASITLNAASENTDTLHNPPAVTETLPFDPQGGVCEIEYPLGPDVQLWDEFSPALYRLSVSLQAETREQTHEDQRDVTFGMREFTTQGTQFAINGRTTFLRGTLECAIFPLTGYPPTDVDAWRRIIRICKSHGLNHIRFHSWCPPEAAFVAADELGFYYQVECASWANQGSTIGDGRTVDAWIEAEADQILRQYGNHPSFVLMAYGNEPAGKNQKRWLGDLVESWKAKDPRRLYTSASGWPVIPESQYHDTPAPRIQAWGAGLTSRINAKPPETVTDYRDFVAKYDVPVVSHEIGQWCVYPNFDEIPKYTGCLKAKNFEIFQQSLTENHMGDQASDFLMASGKLQTLCYKEEIESALRTPGFGGFQLLDLHDFPGQGTALVGVLDPFWDSKPYVSPDEYHRFCCETVPLARMQKRVWTGGEVLSAAIEIAHFGPRDLAEATVCWQLRGSGDELIAEGQWQPDSIPTGKLTSIGKICKPLARETMARRLQLVVSIEDTPFHNDWDLWVYPPATPIDDPTDVLIVNDLNEQAITRLEQGGKVLLAAPASRVKTDSTLGFSSIFWNTAWTNNQPPHTLGILCDPKHPALAAFPTDYHTNWQWWELIHGTAAMQIDSLPADLHPLVQVIDTWFENRRLALAFEAHVASGRLLVTSMDLESDIAERPVARQMRTSLLAYMRREEFAPEVALTPSQVRELFQPPPPLDRFGATVTADTQMQGYPAQAAIDGDPSTIWHTAWGDQLTEHPHYVVLDLQKPRSIRGIRYLPRQDMQNGRVARYAIYVSNHSSTWNSPVASGVWPDGRERQEVLFDAPREGRYIKIEALSEVKGQAYTAIAELDLLAP